MSNNRKIYFKLEKLNSNDVVIEEKTMQLTDGDVRVSYDDVNRRTASFTLLESLPSSWMSFRWKPYYGLEINGEIEYTPLGVFIPINPQEEEELSDYITKFQGVDKAILLADEFSDIPLTFVAGTTLKEVATTVFGLIGETKLNLEDVPYELATDFTFEEGVSLEHILSTLVKSFPADWYYDRDGYAVLEELPIASQRPIKYNFEEGSDSIHIESSKSIDTSKYWNKVIVIGGTVETGIFRQTYQNDVEVQRAGRKVTRFFKEDAATSQQQVNDLATQFLDAGTRLPATINIQNLPIADLEPKQIIMKNNIKYEVISFNIPLSLELQQIQAGELI